jgi:hypothetical protein
MIDKIDKERRHSMNAAPTRPSNKRQRQGAQEDPKEKQDTSADVSKFKMLPFHV